MTDCISVVYGETEIEWLGLIKPGAICYQNQSGQQHDQLYSYG